MKILSIVSYVVGLGLLLFSIGQFLFSGKVFWWNIFSVVPVIGYVLIVVVSLVLAITSRQRLLIGVGLITTLLLFPSLDLTFPGDSHLNSSADKITVFNWNTELWEQSEPQALVDFLLEQEADIYHLQEAFNDNLEYVDAVVQLQDVFPDFHIRQAGDLVTISKFPIHNVVESENYHLWQGFLRIDVEIQGRDVSFYNVHVPIPMSPNLIWRPAEFWNNTQDLHSARSAHFAALRADLAANSNPVFISGDFNTTKSQLEIWTLLDKYQQPQPTGVGFIPLTFRFAGLKLWRIDWLLYSDDFKSGGLMQTSLFDRSDHDAIRVDLQFRD